MEHQLADKGVARDNLVVCLGLLVCPPVCLRKILLVDLFSHVARTALGCADKMPPTLGTFPVWAAAGTDGVARMRKGWHVVHGWSVWVFRVVGAFCYHGALCGGMALQVCMVAHSQTASAGWC